jgi:hypothetical protein
MSRWRKLGLLYGPNSQATKHIKLISHFSTPVPIHVEKDIYRIFYSGRDELNRSSVGAVEINIKEGTIVQEFSKPFLEFGPRGSFYSEGISLGNCFNYQNTRYISFMGWQNTKNSHWKGDIGKIKVNQDLTLTIEDRYPIIKNDKSLGYSYSYPWVMEVDDQGFIMFYGSTINWDYGNGEMLHTINSSHSLNFLDWESDGTVIQYDVTNIQAASRPAVIKNKHGIYEMWFSYRGPSVKKYRIGYANSLDCRIWKINLEKSGIDVSDRGWDSEMIEYPYVFRHSNQLFMLYNGNGFGSSGFGLAVFDES